MSSAPRLFELVPVPCGHVHHHFSEILACIEENGNPGFEVKGIVMREELP